MKPSSNSKYGHIIFLLQLFVFSCIIMSCYRVFLYVNHSAKASSEKTFTIFSSFINGFHFDVCVSAYLFALPALLLSIFYLSDISYTRIKIPLRIYFISVFTILFIILSTDIPFFSFYNSRLNKGILMWTDDLASMFTALSSYYGYWKNLLLFILIEILFIRYYLFCEKALLQRIDPFPTSRKLNLFIYKFTLFIVSTTALFFGIRGKIDFGQMPLRSEDGFMYENALLNQLTLNPVMTFIESFDEFNLKYADDLTALKEAKEALFINDSVNCSPIARWENQHLIASTNKPNIVILLIESMSANKMGYYHIKEGLTPNLDSIAQSGLLFSNAYSCGQHTHNGIFSTLYGIPSLPGKKLLSDSYSATQPYSGLPELLKMQGYKNTFFCTSSKKFDNMGSFLLNHGFDNIISEEDYNPSEIIDGWGVSDQSLFTYGITELNKQAVKQQPFFATFLTVSSHEGSRVPHNSPFVPVSDQHGDQIYEYTDWCIGNFMRTASQQPWFNNTIFILLGDHGQNFDSRYELPISYHHIPIIFYAPKMIQPKVYTDIAAQNDIPATLMGILQQPYINNTLGIDLLKHKRKYTCFVADNKVGCVDSSYFLIIKPGSEQLYHYKNGKTTNIANLKPQEVAEMKKYTFSILQSTQLLIRNGNLGVCKGE